MTKLTGPEDAIKQAIEGGYYTPYFIGDNPLPKWKKETESVFTDPLFWQALGKARAWIIFGKDTLPYIRGKRKYISPATESPSTRSEGGNILEVEYWAAKWFSTHLWHPEKENEFWQQLP